MSTILVRGENKLGFLTEAAKDPRLKGDLGLLTRIVLLNSGATELEELGPEKVVRGKMRRLELMGYCECTKTLSRRFKINGEVRRQRNKLFFTVDCDKRV